MKNQIQKGDSLTVPAPSGGTISGNGYLIGSIFGIAATTKNEGDDVVMWTRGVFTLPKNSAEAWTVGQLIYWDATNKRCTITVSTNTKIGVAIAAAANPSAAGQVRLNGVF